MGAKSDQAITICTPFVGDSVGGSHISALTFLRSLDPVHYRPLVVVHTRGPLTDLLEPAEIPYSIVPLRRIVGQSTCLASHAIDLMSATSALTTWLLRRQPQHVYTNDLRMHLTWSLASRLSGTPHTWHQRTRWPTSRLAHLLGRLPGAILTVSDYSLSTMPENLRQKAVVVRDPVNPLSLDRTAARAALCSELGLDPACSIVGFIGAFTAQKRPSVFIETAAVLKSLNSYKLHFVMLGKDRGLLSSCQAQIAALGLKDDVTLLGYRDPVEPLIAAMDILFAPAVEEAFGRTLVEAMLAGTAVVASRSGGHCETILDGETGFLVEPDVATRAGEVIRALLQEPSLLHATTRRATVAIASRHDVAHHAAIMRDIFTRAECHVSTSR